MDIRTVKDICNSCNMLEKLDKINFVSYNSIKDNKICEFGLIAQDICNILQNITTTDDGFIPDINTNNVEHDLISNDTVFIRLNYNIILNEGDVIYIHINNYYTIPTIVSNPTGVSFEVKKWPNYDKNDILYIYGKKVTDYYKVDMLQLVSLSAGSTKELYQIVKQQASTISTLQNQLNQVITWATAQGFTLTQ